MTRVSCRDGSAFCIARINRARETLLSLSKSFSCTQIESDHESLMGMRKGSIYPFCTQKNMDRTRIRSSYWTIHVVTSARQNFYVNEDRF